MSDVNRLLEAMGLAGKLREGTEAMLASLRESLSGSGALSPDKWSQFEADLRAHPIDELLLEQIRLTITLSPEEIAQVVAFYESPKGKRIMEKMGLVNSAVDRAMQSWLEPKLKAAASRVLGV